MISGTYDVKDPNRFMQFHSTGVCATNTFVYMAMVEAIFPDYDIALFVQPRRRKDLFRVSTAKQVWSLYRNANFVHPRYEH